MTTKLVSLGGIGTATGFELGIDGWKVSLLLKNTQFGAAMAILAPHTAVVQKKSSLCVLCCPYIEQLFLPNDIMSVLILHQIVDIIWSQRVKQR